MIEFKKVKYFSKEQLHGLFASVGWDNAAASSRLLGALESSDAVVSAWDQERLIGLVNALSDCGKTVYVHYVLVHKEYQGKGAGKGMMKRIVQNYQHCRHMTLVSNDSQTGFFAKCGFHISKGATAMEIRRRS
jgi:N-acetylglutamate synthase-like GNAT family acetyltransferase